MQQEQIPNTQKTKRKIWIIIVSIISAFICLCIGAIVIFRIQTDLQQRQYIDQPTPIPDKAYVELRTAALNRKPSELGLGVDPNDNKPYGVIMDWNVGQATSTLVSFATGDASLYYSTGGGWLGGIAIEKVNSASVQLVVTANEYVDQLNAVTTFPMPPVGYVRFYIITPQGIYDSGDVDGDKLIRDGLTFHPYPMPPNTLFSKYHRCHKNRLGTPKQCPVLTGSPSPCARTVNAKYSAEFYAQIMYGNE